MDTIVAEQLFKISHTTLEIVDIGAGDLSFGDRVEANALDAGLLA